MRPVAAEKIPDPEGATGAPSLAKAIFDLMKLALPLALAQILSVSIMTTDIWMMGQLSTLDLAAGSLAIRFYQPFYFFALGLLGVITPFVAQGRGQNDDRLIRRSFRMGLCLGLVIGILFAIIVAQGSWILPALGQDPDVVAHADMFLLLSALSLPVLNLFLVLRFFVMGFGKTRLQLAAVIVGLTTNLLLNPLLAYGYGPLPALGLTGIGIATLISFLVMIIMLVSAIHFTAPFQLYQPFRRWWVMDWQISKRQLRIGFPNAVMITTETSMFAIASIMIGAYGASALAAAAIANQVAALTFMLPLGIAQAAAITLGLAAGKNNSAMLLIMGKAALIMGSFITLIMMICLWLGMEGIISLFLRADNDDFQQVRTVAISLFIITALFQIPDGLQAILSGGLRGINDTFWPAIIGLISFWAIGLGSAYLMGFTWALGPGAIWAGVALGLVAATIGLVVRWQMRMKAIAKGGQILLQ